MKLLKKFTIIAILVIAAVLIIQGVFLTDTDPNSLKKTYTLSDFPAAGDSETAERLVDNVNNALKDLRENPDGPDVYIDWITIANNKRALGDIEGSEAAYFKAIEVNDADPLAYLNLGTLYKTNTGEYEKAEQFYLEAHSRINYPYYSDYESLADLYVNFWPQAKADVEALMLEGANKVTDEDKVAYYHYLYRHFRDIDQNSDKQQEYSDLVHAIDPEYELD